MVEKEFLKAFYWFSMIIAKVHCGQGQSPLCWGFKIKHEYLREAELKLTFGTTYCCSNSEI